MSRGRFHLTLPPELVDEPIIHTLGQQFGLVTNIKRASINERLAWVIIELDGPDDALENALAWLVDHGVQVDRLEDGAPS